MQLLMFKLKGVWSSVVVMEDQVLKSSGTKPWVKVLGIWIKEGLSWSPY